MVHQQRKDPLEGATVDGRYVVQSRLARGGMSTVYLATDRRLDRRVALKVLYPHLADEPGFVDRFEQEAKSAARLSHPRVVGVLDQGVDTIGGQALAYLVMEFVPGRTLRDVLREHGRLPPRRALDLLDAVVEGLAAAHEAGLIHRDVKPENVLLSDGGQVKIADFGLARAVSATTGTATLVGTVAYLSPELVLGRPAEAQSDIYSIGVLLFELLTGHQPFTGETPIQVAIQHAQSEVPAPSVLLPGLAPDIDELVLWCTSRDPEDRPVDGSALLGELRHIRQTLTDEELDFAPAAASSPALHQDQLTATAIPRLPDDGRTKALSRVDPEGDEDAASPPGSTEVLPHAAHQDNATSVVRRHSNATRVIGAVPAVPPPPSAPSAASGSATPTGEFPNRAAQGTRPGSGVSDEDGSGEDGFGEDGFGEDGFGDEQHRHGYEGSAGARPSGGRPSSGRTGSTVRPPSRRQQARQAQRPQNTLHGRGARRSVRLLVVLLVLLAGLTAAAGWFFGSGPGGVVSLPDVADVPLATARAALNEEGFAVGTIEEQYNESVVAGIIVGQVPEQGAERRRGSAVDLTVSLGPEPVAVPDVTGLPEQDAVAAVEQAGLEAVVDDAAGYSRTVPAGAVLGQSPSGQVQRETRVTLTLSRGPRIVRVPNAFSSAS
ncbi:protein kinase domain-containing protein [Arthrobacter sp. MDT2-2]